MGVGEGVGGEEMYDPGGTIRTLGRNRFARMGERLDRNEIWRCRRFIAPESLVLSRKLGTDYCIDIHRGERDGHWQRAVGQGVRAERC